MTPVEAAAFLEGITTIANIFGEFGLPGIIIIVCSGPAFVLIAIVYMNHLATMRSEKAQAEFRDDMNGLLEAYRADTQKVLNELGSNYENVVQFYKSNVVLVKNYEKMTDATQTLVVNNTRALEHLSTIITERKRST